MLAGALGLENAAVEAIDAGDCGQLSISSSASSRRRASRITGAWAPSSRQRGDDRRLVRRVRRAVRARDARPGAWTSWSAGREAAADPSFAAEVDALGREAGRPTPLTLAERYPPGTRLYLKHMTSRTRRTSSTTHWGRRGAARRLGKPRIVAETEQASTGVAAATRGSGRAASSTWAQRTCAPAAQRRAHGPARRRGSPCRLRHAHAQGGDERGDPRLGSRTSARRAYLIGSCVGPHPYPTIVRELQAVIGQEARQQFLAAEGRLP